jgi:hypothetical protein
MFARVTVVDGLANQVGQGQGTAHHPGGAKNAGTAWLLRQLLAWRPQDREVVAVGRLVSVEEYEVIAEDPGRG